MYRPVARAATACALALTLLGSAATLAQHAPGPPAFSTPTPTAEAPATMTAATPAASTVIGNVRAFSVQGQPVAMSPDGKWLAGPGPERDFCI